MLIMYLECCVQNRKVEKVNNLPSDHNEPIPAKPDETEKPVIATVPVPRAESGFMPFGSDCFVSVLRFSALPPQRVFRFGL
jgi:hypothetical protein